MALLAIFLLSTLSYKFVEVPFRKKKIIKSKKKVFTISAVFSLIIVLTGFHWYKGDGWPDRITKDPDVRKHLAFFENAIFCTPWGPHLGHVNSVIWAPKM